MVRSIIAAQFKVSWTQVTAEARFVEDLGADSLDLLQLVLEIEEELDLEIPDEAGEQFRCLADVLAFIAIGKGE
ncbi:acyl carrier protein [Solimonas sp. K1W22B-7]|nr:acyl carrier protein [Solimonas sp. K1W22B-7]AXQ31832.1 acyl carrier protein [Solimonas sp. K1W22B-7]